MKNLQFSKYIFFISCGLILFGYGTAVGRYELFPYSIIKYGEDSLDLVFQEKGTLLGIRPSYFLFPSHYEGTGITRLKADQAVPGLTFMLGFFDGNNEARLIRLDGSIVERWPVKYFDIFPDPKHIQPENPPESNWNVGMQGGLILPDGSVVLDFDYAGTVKLDRCGAVVWTVPRRTHHSIEPAEGGGFWIPSRRYVEKESRFPIIKAPYWEDTILRVSDGGDVLKEISIFEILFKNNLQGLFFRQDLAGDIFHLNDVEELTREMAGRFPEFAPGDLLISLRHLDLIMVVDPETLKVKWRRVGPWLLQHDPDFLRSGKISVFNNNSDSMTGSKFGGSNILEIDPVNDEVSFRYGALKGQRMYTFERGEHQYIGTNGNVLITEDQSGRVFEVNAAGDIVWEFINRYDNDEVTLVSGAIRYPENYFTVRDWTCRPKE